MTGHINITLRGGEYHIDLIVGNQSVGIAYANECRSSAEWYARQLADMINKTGGDVQLYCDKLFPKLSLGSDKLCL